jgi:hypothetical protein
MNYTKYFNSIFLKIKNKSILPPEYEMSIFKFDIKFTIPGFIYKSTKFDRSLSLSNINSEDWYNDFIDKVVSSIGKNYLPICRISDGEFLFFLGKQSLDIRYSFFKKLKLTISNFKSNLILKGGIGPFTNGHYHSGEYTSEECLEARKMYPGLLKFISEKGILALHLSYSNIPFHESYFPALNNWLISHSIKLDNQNYYSFYFVYAMLTGLRKKEIYVNRKILVINGANGEKKDNIIKGILNEGAREVYWVSISLKKSLYDKIDINDYVGKVDLVFVGAGIGKPNILIQLEKLNVPCIDAGYVFEIWADPINKFKRAFCANDEDWKNNSNLLAN